ncbi:hypothetical protein [Acinetobacter baumannii]|uniref:hypothetical protein n=1 Tax=Acinetobacter baumannii TaxID=470 RepID=UPI0019011C60|nr:hypothetical protein [Acinetobacter baumannii]MBJ9388255.1 hypothetical protein [Acinetobacter baumannii]MBJ9432313.1 hypothetical protein [Acinetobacter baumannii]
MSEFKRITVVNQGVFVVVDQMYEQQNQKLKFRWINYINQAGHRIDNDLGDDSHIENRISPLCKSKDV